MPHDIVKDPNEWMRYAKSDLAIAKVNLPEEDVYEQLCFHTQQAAEKALKAVMLKSGVDFPFSHNLQLLLDLLADRITVPSELYDIVELNAYAVITRYPGNFEEITEAQYIRALHLAKTTVEWAESII